MSSKTTTDDAAEKIERIHYCPQCERGLRIRIPRRAADAQVFCEDCGTGAVPVPGAVDVAHVIEDALDDAGYERHIANCTPQWAAEVKEEDGDEWGLTLEIQVWNGDESDD